MARYTHVIWDWNGTLFDDLAVCVTLINGMLDERGLTKLDTDAYRHVFGFPIEEYYARIGFDFGSEPFDALAVEYMKRYVPESEKAMLMNGAQEVLARLHEAGVKQVLLSASKQEILLSQVRRFPIERYFDEIIGADTIHAVGKRELAMDWWQDKRGAMGVCIGDTVHDAEVASALPCHCLLLPNGHHAKERLMQCDAMVLDDIADVPPYVLEA